MSIRKRKILIVEDEIDLSILLLNDFEEEGFEVFCCDNGRYALEKIQSFRPDIVFLDIKLPDMTGWDVCGEIRRKSKFANIPVVIFTANQDVNFDEKVEEFEVDRLVFKPYQSDVLLDLVYELLELNTLKNLQFQASHQKF